MKLFRMKTFEITDSNSYTGILCFLRFLLRTFQAASNGPNRKQTLKRSHTITAQLFYRHQLLSHVLTRCSDTTETQESSSSPETQGQRTACQDLTELIVFTSASFYNLQRCKPPTRENTTTCSFVGAGTGKSLSISF